MLPSVTAAAGHLQWNLPQRRDGGPWEASTHVACCGSAVPSPEQICDTSRFGRRGNGVPAIPTPAAFHEPAQALTFSSGGSPSIACSGRPGAASAGSHCFPRAPAGARDVRRPKGWQGSDARILPHRSHRLSGAECRQRLLEPVPPGFAEQIRYRKCTPDRS